MGQIIGQHKCVALAMHAAEQSDVLDDYRGCTAEWVDGVSVGGCSRSGDERAGRAKRWER